MALERKRKPAITLSQTDHERLSRLAESVVDRNPVVADELFAELDRARVVADTAVPAGVVRMGSALRYTTDAGDDRVVTLVYPGEADIEAGKVSVLTPIGAALIGLSAGQSIDWTGLDGRVHRLTVKSIEPAGSRPAAEAELGHAT